MRDEKIRVGFLTRILNRMTPEKVLNITKILKIFSVFLMIMLALVMMALQSQGIQGLKDQDLINVPKNPTAQTTRGAPVIHETIINPDLIRLISSLTLNVLALLISALIMYKLIKKQNVNLYKLVIFPIIILLIALFIVIEQQAGLQKVYDSRDLKGIKDNFAQYANLLRHSFITFGTLGLTYLSVISTIILIELGFTNR